MGEGLITTKAGEVVCLPPGMVYRQPPRHPPQTKVENGRLILTGYRWSDPGSYVEPEHCVHGKHLAPGNSGCRWCDEDRAVQGATDGNASRPFESHAILTSPINPPVFVRRYRQAYLSSTEDPELSNVLQALSGLTNAADFPADSKLVRLMPDPGGRKGFTVTMEHRSFDIVKEGDPPPEFPATVEAVQGATDGNSSGG